MNTGRNIPALAVGEVQGVFIAEPEKIEDERGFFARIFDENDFFIKGIQFGIRFNLVQASISYNRKRDTLRGMHWQSAPYLENKIVQCINGSIFDVILDMRENSATYKKWYPTILSDENNALLYIPAGVAHGFLTLEDDTMVMYWMDIIYNKKASRVINYKSCGIKWPFSSYINKPTVISDRDMEAPIFV